MNDMQNIFNAIFAATRSERSNYHLTLGELIYELKTISNFDMPVVVESVSGLDLHPTEEDSYRGYYHDLAFALGHDLVTVEDLLIRCELALTNTYEGYKGGDYTMDRDTPLWIASYGIATQE